MYNKILYHQITFVNHAHNRVLEVPKYLLIMLLINDANPKERQ
jgi:hypothetical protein